MDADAERHTREAGRPRGRRTALVSAWRTADSTGLLGCSLSPRTVIASIRRTRRRRSGTGVSMSEDERRRRITHAGTTHRVRVTGLMFLLASIITAGPVGDARAQQPPAG